MQAETESTDTEENSEAEGEAEEANPEIEEGYTTELDGCTKWFPGVKWRQQYLRTVLLSS